MTTGRTVPAAFVLAAFLCSSAVPAATLVARNDTEARAALNRARPGDTVALKAGQYAGHWQMKPGKPGRRITLRAERRGRVFVGRFPALSGFRKVEGFQYVHVAPYDSRPARLLELDTNRSLREVLKAADAEEIVGSWAFDSGRKRLYVHPTDSADAGRHVYAPIHGGSNIRGIGVLLADYTAVEGLVLRGFGLAALYSPNKKGVAIRDCVAYGNGYGVWIRGGSDCLVSGNTLWLNSPTYEAGAQLHVSCSPPANRIVVENNVVHTSRRIAVRFYSGVADDGVLRGNLLYGNAWGAYFKVNRTKGNLVAETNVAFGNPTGELCAPVMRRNTYARFRVLHRGKKGADDLVVADLRADPRFADPAYHDYRLQADSPARGKAPGGRDLGAFPYDGSVLFVKPDGDDAKEGTSVASAFRTLVRASRALKAGQTLYILPGDYREPLALTGLKASAERPTRVRAHGKGKVTVAGVRVRDCEGLAIEGLRVEGAAGDAFAFERSADVAVRSCVSRGARGAGVAAADCRRLTVEHCALCDDAGGAVDLRAGVEDAEIVSCLLTGKGDPVRKAPGVKDVWEAFNLANVAAGYVGLGAGDFDVWSGSPASVGGRYGLPVGPGAVRRRQDTGRKPIERVRVLSVAATTANILFDTPGMMSGTLLEWGLTPKYGQSYDRGSRPSYSEYEVVHTVSLVNLKPRTRYHFRVGTRARGRKAKGGPKILWSEDHTFTTAAEEPAPRRLFVSLKGSDANDGSSPAKAWRTLRKAAREARAGDTVTILPGRYAEPVRPLQTGASETRRVTFRAEKPLTVFLDGGFNRSGREGRSHAVLIQGKAFITVENLTLERCARYDKGGYRGGWGYAGLVRVSGSAMIELNNIVMDGRYRWMTGFVCHQGGLMPGLRDPAYAARMSDSVTLGCWKSFMGAGQRGPVILDHFLSYLVRIVSIQPTSYGRGSKVKIRNSVLHDRCRQKRRSAPIYNPGDPRRLDVDHNAYCWMPKSRPLYVRFRERGKPPIQGIEAWRAFSKQDAHSVEIMMTSESGVYPGTFRLDYDGAGKRLPPVKIEDFVLPAGSPLRGKGEGGTDLGPRWQKFLGRP